MRSRSCAEPSGARGVWTISAGNAGQGVAYAGARRRHPVHRGRDRDRAADQARPDARARRDASSRCPTIEAWSAVESARVRRRSTARFIHPFDNHDFIAGHGTMGLEILEDCPDVATRHLRDRRRRPDHRGRQRDQGAEAGHARVLGAEPETAAPYALSLREGGPRRFSDWQARFVDGAGGQSVTRADVAADAAGGRRRDHRHARSDARGDAADRREVADDRRRRGRAVAWRRR